MWTPIDCSGCNRRILGNATVTKTGIYHPGCKFDNDRAVMFGNGIHIERATDVEAKTEVATRMLERDSPNVYTTLEEAAREFADSIGGTVTAIVVRTLPIRPLPAYPTNREINALAQAHPTDRPPAP